MRKASLVQFWHEPSQRAIFLSTDLFFSSLSFSLSFSTAYRSFLLGSTSFCSRKLKSSHNREFFFGIWLVWAIFSPSFQSLFPANFSYRMKVNAVGNIKCHSMRGSRERCSTWSWDGIKPQSQWKLSCQPALRSGASLAENLCSRVVGTNHGLCFEWKTPGSLEGHRWSSQKVKRAQVRRAIPLKQRQQVGRPWVFWGSRYQAIAASYCLRNGKKS